MTRLATARFIEAVFGNVVLVLTPLVLVLTYGVFATFTAQSEYTSAGTVFTEHSSFVADLTGITGTDTYLSPAQAASEELYGLLQTDVFIEGVLVDAGIELAPALLRFEQLGSARAALSTNASSENLLLIRATTDEPVVSQRLAQAAIDRFIEFKIAADVKESIAAAVFFEELAAVYQEEVSEARATLNAFMGSVSASTVDDLAPAESLEIERLTQAEDLASTRYANALDNLEASRLAELQARTDVQQSLSIVDPPQQPEFANGGITTSIISLGIYGIAGLVLSAIGPLLAAVFNRSVLFEEELSQFVPVLAVVPRAKKRDLDIWRAEIPPSNHPTQRIDKSVSVLAEPTAGSLLSDPGDPGSGPDDRWVRRARA